MRMRMIGETKTKRGTERVLSEAMNGRHVIDPVCGSSGVGYRTYWQLVYSFGEGEHPPHNRLRVSV